MLTSIKIQNLALAESVNWNVNEGLTAITGETGAGKSVIIGALKLLSGERTDKSIIRSGEEKATIQGAFSLEQYDDINAILEEAGLPECDEGFLLLRRIIGQKGSRQFINDEPCTLGTMRRIGEHLMDLHGPHDHQSLFSNDKQLQLLDRYAGLKSENLTYKQHWQSYLAYRNEYEEFLESEMLSEDELDLFRYQLDEISEANLNPDEIAQLEEQYQRATNSSSITESVGAAISLLSDEQGVLTKVNELLRTTNNLQSLDHSLTEDLAPVEAASLELQEIESVLHTYLDKLESDPTALQELEERINTIETLKRKYGGSVEEILLHAERVNKKLSQTEQRETMLVKYQDGMMKHEKKLTSLANKLSKAREKQAPLLAKEITTHLQDLGFKQAKFALEIMPQEQLTPYGLEKLEFTFGPNPGEPTKPLKQVASSGEMSRVMLALKSSLAEHDAVPLLVFDEIDANVGGEIAAAVGQKMKTLSKQRQVLSITHFPQVAAIAPSHGLVYKRVVEGRTTSQMEELDGDKRVQELVRMLGATGDQATALAKSLLENS